MYSFTKIYLYVFVFQVSWQFFFIARGHSKFDLSEITLSRYLYNIIYTSTRPSIGTLPSTRTGGNTKDAACASISLCVVLRWSEESFFSGPIRNAFGRRVFAGGHAMGGGRLVGGAPRTPTARSVSSIRGARVDYERSSADVFDGGGDNNSPPPPSHARSVRVLLVCAGRQRGPRTAFGSRGYCTAFLFTRRPSRPPPPPLYIQSILQIVFVPLGVLLLRVGLAKHFSVFVLLYVRAHTVSCTTYQ